MGESIAVLVLTAAVLGAALRWEVPAASPPPAPATPVVKSNPRATDKIKIRKIAVDQDNSNSSYAALGLRASCVPEGAPPWIRRAGCRLESLNRSFTWSLKLLARKSILGRVT